MPNSRLILNPNGGFIAELSEVDCSSILTPAPAVTTRDIPTTKLQPSNVNYYLSPTANSDSTSQTKSSGSIIRDIVMLIIIGTCIRLALSYFDVPNAQAIPTTIGRGSSTNGKRDNEFGIEAGLLPDTYRQTEEDVTKNQPEDYKSGNQKTLSETKATAEQQPAHVVNIIPVIPPTTPLPDVNRLPDFNTTISIPASVFFRIKELRTNEDLVTCLSSGYLVQYYLSSFFCGMPFKSSNTTSLSIAESFVPALSVGRVIGNKNPFYFMTKLYNLVQVNGYLYPENRGDVEPIKCVPNPTASLLDVNFVYTINDEVLPGYPHQNGTLDCVVSPIFGMTNIVEPSPGCNRSAPGMLFPGYFPRDRVLSDGNVMWCMDYVMYNSDMNPHVKFTNPTMLNMQNCLFEDGITVFRNGHWYCIKLVMPNFSPYKATTGAYAQLMEMCNVHRSNLHINPERGYYSWPPAYNSIIVPAYHGIYYAKLFNDVIYGMGYSFTGLVDEYCSTINYNPVYVTRGGTTQARYYENRYDHNSFYTDGPVTVSGQSQFYLNTLVTGTVNPIFDTIQSECCLKALLTPNQIIPASYKIGCAVLTKTTANSQFLFSSELYSPGYMFMLYNIFNLDSGYILGVSYSSQAYNYYVEPNATYTCLNMDNATNFINVGPYPVGVNNTVYFYSATYMAGFSIKSTEPMFMQLGNYAQDAYAPYLMIGIDSITDVKNSRKITTTFCDRYISCAIIPAGLYHIEYTTTSVETATANFPVQSTYDSLNRVSVDFETHSFFGNVTGTMYHKTVRINDNGANCPFLSSIESEGYCFETTERSNVRDDFLTMYVPVPSPEQYTAMQTVNGYFDQDILFVPLKNGSFSIQMPYFLQPFYVPTPLVQLTLEKGYPVVNIQRSAGKFFISYSCYGKTQQVVLDTHISNFATIPCKANAIQYAINSYPLQWKTTGKIYMNQQFTGYDDALTWKNQNPTLFWFMIALSFILLPVALFLFWRLLVPLCTHIILLLARLSMVCVWSYRVLTFRWNPPLRRFWHAIYTTGSFSGFIGSRKTPNTGLQFKWPSVPRIHWASPYAAIVYCIHIMLLLSVFLCSNGTDASIVNFVKATPKVSRLALSSSEYTGQIQQSRLDEPPNRFGDIFGFSYTVQGVNGNQGTVLTSFSGIVGQMQMITYQPSTSTGDFLLQKPILVKIYNSDVHLTTVYQYTTGPSTTYFKNSCVYFSQKCPNSELNTRMPCTPVQQYSYYIGYSACCPTKSQAYATGASCLDTHKQSQWSSCYIATNYEPVVNFTVTVDDVEHKVFSDGTTFKAGSCTGTVSTTLRKTVSLNTICCNGQGCKNCNAPKAGTLAETNKLGDIQMRGTTVDASPVSGVHRAVKCAGSGQYCSYTTQELGGFKQFDDPAICNEHLSETFDCLSQTAESLGTDQEKLIFTDCNPNFVIEMLCNATVIPKPVEYLLADFSVSCPEGIYGYIAGLVCNYTISNLALTPVSVKPEAYVENAVSPFVSVSDVVVGPTSTMTCYSCVVISSNVAKLTIQFTIPQTDIDFTLKLELKPPPEFTPITPGDDHTVVYHKCSYGTKLKAAWSHVGQWISLNLGFFIPYFCVIGIMTIIMYTLTFYYKLSAKYIVIFTVLIIISLLLLAFIGPLCMTVPGCD